MKFAGKYRITSYHCPNCGGATDPMSGTCKYCDSEISLRPFGGKLKQRQVRIMIDCGEDYIYFDRIMSLQQQMYRDFDSYIDITGNIHNQIHDLGRRADVRISIDKRGLDLIKKIDFGKIYDTRIEFLWLDKAFEMKSYIPMFEWDSDAGFHSNTRMMGNLSFISASETKEFNGLVPSDATCPNCGAPVKSRYGCCDWCGGWIEYEW